jgi:hypothetical protein
MSYNIGNPHAFWGTFTRSESKPAIKLIDKGTLDNNSSLWVVHFPDDATTQSGFGEVTVSKGSISSQEGYCHFKFGRNPAGNVEVAFLDQTTDVTFHNSDYGYDFCIVSSPTNDAIFFINYTGESKFILYEITCSSGF